MLRVSLLFILLWRSSSSTLMGWVESPGYPSGYPAHASLNWSRCAPKGHTLSIRLLHLDLEDSHDCENDAVKVFSNRNLISVLCGRREFEELQSTVSPSLVSTPGGCLTLTFHSDYSNTKRHTGFRGFYTVQDFDECKDDPDNGCSQFCHNIIGGYRCSCRHGYDLNVDKHTCAVSCSEDLSGQKKGAISSPFWPHPYAENTKCQYTLSVETHLQLELGFQDFDVEQSKEGQCIDSLRIETPSGTLGPFCGRAPPPSPLLTHSHQAKIVFITDGFGNNKGFTLRFSTRAKVCPAVVTPHSTAAPQTPQHHEGQTVTVTCDLGYVINTEEVQTLTAQYETTCQRTGDWVPRYPCEPVNCGPPDISADGVLQLVGSDNLGTYYGDQIRYNCTSEYYKLEGEDLYTCSAKGEWISESGASEEPKCTPVCGIPAKRIRSTGRILGGLPANVGEIPWQLLIREPYRAGASLINDQWAVTAAHVVDNLEDTSLQLYGGFVHGSRASDAVVMDSAKIIIHPGYLKDTLQSTSTTRINFDNDIALIKFASRVSFGPNLLPICLPQGKRGLVENEQGTVSGWGKTDARKNQDALVTSRVLKYAHIGVYSLKKCQDTPRTPTNVPMMFTDNMFCAGADGRDSCQKDSGSSFVSPMLSSGSGPYYLTGIVSWGPPCEERRFKGYYTKVENYVGWIKETIEKEEKS